MKHSVDAVLQCKRRNSSGLSATLTCLSAAAVSLTIPGWALARHTLGPGRTIRMAQGVCDGFRCLRQPASHVPGDVESERAARILGRLQLRPWIACFETACAFSVWLAIFGHFSKIRVGKRMQAGELLMHAWVESNGDRYYFDARFEPIFE